MLTEGQPNDPASWWSFYSRKVKHETEHCQLVGWGSVSWLFQVRFGRGWKEGEEGRVGLDLITLGDWPFLRNKSPEL